MQFIKRKLCSKKFWKQGGGELLGFALTVPVVIFLVCCVVSAFQVAIANQELSYAAYNCGRAAVVSDSYELGSDRAKDVYGAIIEGSGDGSYIPCEIELLDGETWGKGAYIKCTVRLYVDVLMPFTSGIREQSVVMMVENG